MSFSTRIQRGDSSVDSYSRGFSDFSRSPNVAIPMSSMSGRFDHGPVNAPPALPPPRHPITDPLNSEAPRNSGYNSLSFGSRYASGSSAYWSTAGSSSSGSSDAFDFRRREIPLRDEGYSSLSSKASSLRQSEYPAQKFLTHSNYSFKSYGDSVKDKLDPRPAQPRSGIADTQPSAPSQSPRRSVIGGPPHLSIPPNRALLEEPERFMQTPLHTTPSTGFPGFSAGDRPQDDDQSRRTVSRSPPGTFTQTSTEEGEIEVMRLSIEDGASHLTPGQKRRASSPVVDETPSYASFATIDLRRRDGAARGSPVPRLGMRQSSFSSASSVAARNSSHMYTTSSSGLSAPVPSPNHGRKSPVMFSPSAISPLAASAESASPPFSGAAPSAPLDPSPMGSIPRIVSPPQRSMTEASRPMHSSRKMSTRPAGAGGMQQFFMCECCLKKPKKFDTIEQLQAHEAEKQYECQYCGNRFKNKNEAERHQNSLHVRPHSWSCSALTSYERAYHESTQNPGQADTCGYCGEEFARNGDFSSMDTRGLSSADWDVRARHLQEVHKFRECNSSKKFYRADHFRQHLKHSHAGTSGKWTNMLENACMIDEEQPMPPN